MGTASYIMSIPEFQPTAKLLKIGIYHLSRKLTHILNTIWRYLEIFGDLEDLERSAECSECSVGSLEVLSGLSFVHLYAMIPESCRACRGTIRVAPCPTMPQTQQSISIWATVVLWAAFCFVVPHVASVIQRIFFERPSKWWMKQKNRSQEDLTRHQTSFCEYLKWLGML